MLFNAIFSVLLLKRVVNIFIYLSLPIWFIFFNHDFIFFFIKTPEQLSEDQYNLGFVNVLLRHIFFKYFLRGYSVY